MEIEAVHSLYHALAGDTHTFLYSGSFHDEHTVPLIALGEQLVGGREGQRLQRNRLTFVMVEAYQNIIRHRASLPPELTCCEGRSVFLLHHRNEGQVVGTVNPVLREDADKLRETFRGIQGLDRKQLKELFLRALQGGRINARGGAGLGLIEMARRSGNPLRQELLPMDSGHELFSLQVAVGSGIDMDGLPAAQRPSELQRLMAQNDVLLFHRGRPLPGILEAMLRMVQRDMEDRPDKAKARTRAFLASTEVLQALDPGSTHEGLLLLHGDAEGYGIAIGTWLTAKRSKELQEEVLAINDLGPAELQQRYRQLLKDMPGPNGHVTMGLLELARHRRAPLAAAGRPDGSGEFVVVMARV